MEPSVAKGLKATFAVSESGYMDNELRLEYMKKYFELHTRGARSVPRCLIVDGHSSHTTWAFVKYALDHDIHVICLPSKSTHLLQPLDVGCFGVLQTTYEKNLSSWLRANPLSVISKPSFLEILHKTRGEVYTESCIVGAWRKSRCWPIDRNFLTQSGLILPDHVLDNTNIRALDTPSRLHSLSHVAEEVMRLKLNPEEKSPIYQLIDFAGEKITKHRDIAPRADTLKKLRNGKVRKERIRSRHIPGEARVLSYQHINDGLKKLEDGDAEKVKKQQLAEERRRASEERKIMRETLLAQWKIDLQEHTQTMVPQWQAECTEIDADWAAAKQIAGRSTKKPAYPSRPKRPIKPKFGGDISILIEDMVREEEETEEGEGYRLSSGGDGDLVDSMQALGITHFAEVSALQSTSTILLFH